MLSPDVPPGRESGSRSAYAASGLRVHVKETIKPVADILP